MNINITETAKEKIDKAISESEFQSPALRVIFAGYG
jgi:Fe-S cluster assembly iron-binding protein IscA